GRYASGLSYRFLTFRGHIGAFIPIRQDQTLPFVKERGESGKIGTDVSRPAVSARLPRALRRPACSRPPPSRHDSRRSHARSPAPDPPRLANRRELVGTARTRSPRSRSGNPALRLRRRSG